MRLSKLLSFLNFPGDDLANACNDAMSASQPSEILSAVDRVFAICNKYEAWPLPDHSKNFVLGRMHGLRGFAYQALAESDPGKYVPLALDAFEKSETFLLHEDPTDLAVARLNLGNIYKQSVEGSQADNIEKAIVVHENALADAQRGGNKDVITDCRVCLAASLKERHTGNNLANRDRAKQLAELALSEMPSGFAGLQRASLHQLLGDLYARHAPGDREENFQRALAEYQRALSFVDQRANPTQWAAVLGNLSMALIEDPNVRTRPEKLEEALQHNTTCKKIFEREGALEHLAVANLNRSTILALRVAGDPIENRKEAASAVKDALQFYDADRYPEQHSKLLSNLAALLNDGRQDKASATRVEALELARSAIALVDKMRTPRQWADSAVTLANALYATVGEHRPRALDEALELYQEALEAFDQDSNIDAKLDCLLNLSNVWADRMAGKRAENQERSISLLETALEIVDWRTFPDKWLSTRLNLGLSLIHRSAGFEADNVEFAIALADEALAFTDPRSDSTKRFSLFELLGDAYLRRARGSLLENLRKAEWAYDEAKATGAHSSESDAGKRITFKRRRTVGTRRWRENSIAESPDTQSPPIPSGWREVSAKEHLVELQRESVDLDRDSNPMLWRESLDEQSEIWLAYAPTGVRDEFGEFVADQISNAHVALELLEKALASVDSDHEPTIAAYYWERLERVYSLLQRWAEWPKVAAENEKIPEAVLKTDPSEYLSSAVECLRNAVDAQRRAGSNPQEIARLLSMLGEKYCEIELWGEARRVFEECSAGLNELVASVEANSTDLTVSLGVLGKVAKFAPYACLMEGDWKSALELKEVGQARLLAKAISLNALPMTNEMRSAIVQLEKEWIALEGKLTSSRTFDRITPLKRIMSIRRELHKLVMDDGFHGTVESGVDAALQLLLSDDCTVAVPVVGSHGGKVLVFRKHGDEIKLQMRDIGSAFELDAILRVKQGVASGDAVRYASGRVRGVRGEGWLEEIEELSKGLRTAFVEPLFDALDDLGAEAGDQILIVGGGEVAALPFHIADIGEMGTTFLDQFEARISPSLAVSSAIISRGENPCSIRNGPITVVCQSDNPELVYLDVEAGLVSSWFSDRSILSAGEAETTADKVLMQLDGSSVWHFCCHGAFDDRDPLNSALQFSSARSLTLKDIVDARGLSPPSLVVLSACETGLHSLKQLPHEYIGLPTAFLQLGASAVVATQWQVGDLAAMLLMGKFYEQLVGDQKRPSEALRNAQLWLRDANVDALNQTMETWVKDGRMTEASMAKARTEFELERFRPASRPFQDKVFWGAFVLHGA